MSVALRCPCGVEVRAGWQFCPACGRAAARTCPRCNNALEASWKVCPFCGDGSTTPAEEPGRVAAPMPDAAPAQASSGPVWEARDLTWSLYDALFRQFLKPLNPLLAAVRQPFAALSKCLAAREPGPFVTACTTGLAAVVQQRTHPVWPAPVRAALADLERQQADLLQSLAPTVSAIRAAVAEVRAANVPDAVWAHHAAKVAATAPPKNEASSGAIGGAALGSLFLPGIGTAIGGVLGAILADNTPQTKHLALVEKYDKAFGQLHGAIEELWRQTWNRFAEATNAHGGSLPGHAHYAEAEKEWNAIRQRVFANQATHADVLSYLTSWGPMPDALRVLFVGCMFHGWGGGVAEATTLAEQARRLFPTRPDTAESHADLALHGRQWAEALRCADQGVRLDGAARRLRLLRLEALGALGRTEEGEATAKRIPDVAGAECAWIAYVRGALRGRDTEAAGVAVTAWLATGSKVPTVVRLLRHDEYLAGHFSGLAHRVPALVPFTQGGAAECAAIVAAQFPPAPVPPEKLANVQSQIVRGDYGPILHFIDWSLWKDGKIGLALTASHVVWRCLWAEPVVIPLKGLKPEQIKGEGVILVVGTQRVNMESSALAKSLAEVIGELCQVVNR